MMMQALRVGMRSIAGYLLPLFIAFPVAASAVPTPTQPAGTTALLIESDPGDYLGAGQHLLLTEADGVFTVTHDPGFLFIRFKGPSRDWDLTFLAPRGQELLPVAYDGASNFPSPRQPGIDVQGEGRFCTGAVGRFTVLELRYAPDETVDRLAIDFEKRCGNRDLVFSGAVRIRSTIPMPGPRTPTPTPRAEDFELWIYDDGGPFSTNLTGGTSPDYGAFSSNLSRNFVQVYPDTDTWQLEFGAPRCHDLVSGVYDNAAVSRHSQELRPTLLISRYPNYQCNISFGGETRFVVRDVQFGEFDYLYKFVAEFEQDCEVGPRFRGGVRYVSKRPTPLPPTPTPTPSDYSSMAVLYGDPEDFVGRCGVYLLTLANGDFSATYAQDVFPPTRNNTVYIVFEGGPNTWTFRFQAPGNGPVVPGHYANVKEWASPDRGGVYIAGQGRACDVEDGELTIQEADFAPDGTVLRFAADFVQYCDSFAPDGTKTYGTVRFHSSLPPPTLNPPHTPSPTPKPVACPGDCNRDGEATVDELVNVVTLALGSREVGPCSSADRSRDFELTVDEITESLQNVLFGCGPVL